MTLSPEAVLQVIDILNETGAPYIVTGSLASNVYSTPRATLDGDFVVDMDSAGLERLFITLAAKFEREAQMAFETVTGKMQHKFWHRETKFLIEIFEARMDDPHERVRFERRRAARIDGRTGYVPTAEDVIVQKLRWYKQIRRVKDREDVRSVMLHQWAKLDWAYIEHWCGEHGSLDMLRQVKQAAQETLVDAGELQ